MPARSARPRAPFSDAEAETLRLQLLEIIPRLRSMSPLYADFIAKK